MRHNVTTSSHVSNSILRFPNTVYNTTIHSSIHSSTSKESARHHTPRRRTIFALFSPDCHLRRFHGSRRAHSSVGRASSSINFGVFRLSHRPSIDERQPAGTTTGPSFSSATAARLEDPTPLDEPRSASPVVPPFSIPSIVRHLLSSDKPSPLRPVTQRQTFRRHRRPSAVVVSSTRTTALSTTRTFDANAFVALARGASARIARSRVNPSSARPNI